MGSNRERGRWISTSLSLSPSLSFFLSFIVGVVGTLDSVGEGCWNHSPAGSIERHLGKWIEMRGKKTISIHLFLSNTLSRSLSLSHLTYTAQDQQQDTSAVTDQQDKPGQVTDKKQSEAVKEEDNVTEKKDTNEVVGDETADKKPTDDAEKDEKDAVDEDAIDSRKATSNSTDPEDDPDQDQSSEKTELVNELTGQKKDNSTSSESSSSSNNSTKLVDGEGQKSGNKTQLSEGEGEGESGDSEDEKLEEPEEKLTQEVTSQKQVPSTDIPDDKKSTTSNSTESSSGDDEDKVAETDIPEEEGDDTEEESNEESSEGSQKQNATESSETDDDVQQNSTKTKEYEYEMTLEEAKTAAEDIAPAPTPVRDIVPPSDTEDDDIAVEYLGRMDTPVVPEAWDNSTDYMGFEYGGEVGSTTLKQLDIPAKCVFWGSPSAVHTFDGSDFSFQGNGEFIAMVDKRNQERVDVLTYRDPKTKASHNVGASFSTGSDIFSVRMIQSSVVGGGAIPELRYNNDDITNFALQTSETQISRGPFTIRRNGQFKSTTRLMVSASNANGTSIAVTFREMHGHIHVNVFVEIPGSSLYQVSGLCGSYDFDPKNDLASRPESLVTGSSVEEMALSWAVRDVADSQFFRYTIPAGAAVLSTELTPANLNATAQNLREAQLLCKQSRTEFFTPCVMNTLMNGREGTRETEDVEDIVMENSVKYTVGVYKCLKDGKFRLSEWNAWTKCDAKCGYGARSRSRTVYIPGVVPKQCGSITQSSRCYVSCEKESVWGTCSTFGNAHFTTFDGRYYDFHASGEYTLYQSLDDKEAVNVVLSKEKEHNVSFVMGAAIRSGPDVVSFRYDNNEVTASYNGRSVGTLSTSGTNLGLMVAKRTTDAKTQGDDKSVVEVKAPGGTTLTLVAAKYSNSTYLFNVFLQVPSSKVKQTKGMCGTFDFDGENDFTDPQGTPTGSKKKFAWSWRVVDKFASLMPNNGQPLIAPPVHSTFSKMKADNVNAYSSATKTCMNFEVEFRHACILDMMANGPTYVVPNLKDVASVLEDQKLEVETEALGCMADKKATLGSWGPYGECSETCGSDGVRVRTRKIFKEDGSECGELSETRVCYNDPCPVDCQVSEYGNFSACSVTCGTGEMFRLRNITVPTAYGGQECPSLNDTQPCVMEPCCEISEWSDWGRCHLGNQTRTRDVNLAKCGASIETRSCCWADKWEEWGECADGEQRRSRRTIPNQCTTHEEKRVCCSKGTWGNWSSCDEGKMKRFRSIVPLNCAQSVEVKTCCSTYPWKEWSACDGGTMTRKRRVVPDGCSLGFEVKQCQMPEKEEEAEEQKLEGANNVTQLLKNGTVGANGKSVVQKLSLASKKEQKRKEAKRKECGEWTSWTSCDGKIQYRMRKPTADATDDCHTHEKRTCDGSSPTPTPSSTSGTPMTALPNNSVQEVLRDMHGRRVVRPSTVPRGAIQSQAQVDCTGDCSASSNPKSIGSSSLLQESMGPALK